MEKLDIVLEDPLRESGIKILDSAFVDPRKIENKRISSGFKISKDFENLVNQARKTSNFSNEVLENAERMAKKLMWLNSAKYTTAVTKASKLCQPFEQIKILQSSRRFNHVHGRRVLVAVSNHRIR